MPGEDKFLPKTPEEALERDRTGWVQKIEKIHNKERIILIMERLGIVITEPPKDLGTAKEALQSFIRGYKEPQLANLETIMRKIEEEDREE